MQTSLGRLVPVALRDVWENEATGFTTWLAQPDNMAVLSETLGLTLDVVAQEERVGPFRADILCKDSDSEQFVLIENQLEQTDHGHLGQLLTYAAGLKAVTVVWVAAKFREEHRAALDWLNDATRDGLNFFGVEVKLYRIGSSAPAPFFDVVSQPNNWTKLARTSAESGGPVTETKALQLAYWTQHRAYLEEKQSPVKMHRPSPQHWNTAAIGRSGFDLNVSLSQFTNTLTVILRVSGENALDYFRLLRAQAEVEAARVLGPELAWEEKPGKKEHWVALRRPADYRNRADWPAQHEWTRRQLEAFDRFFRPRIRTLVLPAFQPEEEALQ